MPTTTRPIDPSTLTKRVRSRFYMKVAEAEENGCTLWTAGVSTKGYGAFRLTGRGMVSAHRVAYVLAHGEDIPAGMMIDHLCRVRRCVNPEHLRVVTNRENLRAEESQHWARTRAEQTHCLRGHLLADENLVSLQLRRKRSRRQCPACQAAKTRACAWRRKHGQTWSEPEVRALADELYAQRRRKAVACGETSEQAMLFDLPDSSQ